MMNKERARKLIYKLLQDKELKESFKITYGELRRGVCNSVQIVLGANAMKKFNKLFDGGSRGIDSFWLGRLTLKNMKKRQLFVDLFLEVYYSGGIE